MAKENKRKIPDDHSDLRRQAEEVLKRHGELDKIPPADLKRIFHELQVHQIELEMQNDELRRVQQELETSREKYVDLYNLAPVGYVTLNGKGIVIESNLTASTLLGVDRTTVVGQPLTHFIYREDQDTYYHYRQRLFETMQHQECRVRMLKGDGTHLWVQLEATVERGNNQEASSRTAIIDIRRVKMAEEAVEKLSHQNELILNSAGEGIHGVDLDGNLTFINPSGAKMLGYEVTELIGRHGHSMFHHSKSDGSKYPELECPIYAAFTDGVIHVGEDELFWRKDGSAFPVMYISTPIMEGEKIKGAVVSFRDITERKRAEEAIRLNEFRLESLLKISQYKAKGTKELLEFALDEAIHLTGSKLGYIYHFDEKRQELILNNWSGEVMKECSIENPPTVYPLEKTGIWGEAVRQRRPIIINDFQAAHSLKKGYPEGHAPLYKYLTVPVIIDDAIVAVVGVANSTADYNETDALQMMLLMDSVWKYIRQRQAEEALTESEKRYHSLFENMSEGSAYCKMLYDDSGTPIDFVYVAVNPAFGRLTGLYNVEGKNVTTVIPGIKESYPELFEIYSRVALTGQPEKFEIEFKPLAAWLSISVYSTEKNYFVAVFDNITERKQAENEMKKARELSDALNLELEAANKALEAFSYSVSHDLRAPLRHMGGFADLLKKRLKGQLDEKSLQYSNLISKSAKKMEQLIDDLLSYSRLGRKAMEKKEVNLGLLLKESLDEISVETKGRDIEWRVGELPTVYCEPLMLKLVLVNLISNAIKFTNIRPRAEIAISCNEGESEVACFIKDNGVGFDMQHVDRLFGVFQRLHTQDEFEGTGIGLANVRRIISLHGGRTWAEGSVGQGATFYFTLPILKQARSK